MADMFTVLKQIKETGKKVVGFYCVYAPQELVLAADALGFALCATKEEAIPDGEKTLPRNFCPLIKSSYGFAVTDKCPYFLYSDIIIGETTCDGKKKMFELMQSFKPVHVMKLPQTYLDETDKAYWLNEVRILKDVLEKELGSEITDEKLRAAIKVLNEERRLMQKLAECMKHDPVPMTGQDFLKLMWGRNFVLDRAEFAAQIKAVTQDMEEAIAKGEAAFPKGAKRILVTGVPTGVGSEKVIKIIEDCSAAVVYIENCSGMKQFVTLVDETKPPLAAIAEKYLATPCSCMSPNPIRLENLAKLLKEYRIDG
ncbi:double-cubane-cluster-containing anaerobic reductase, partial [Sporomusa acidovorans]